MTGEFWTVVVEINVTNVQEQIREMREAVTAAGVVLQDAVRLAPNLKILEETIHDETQMLQEITAASETLGDMLPVGRSRRGLLNLGGKIIKVIFGNPDADDLQSIHNKLEDLSHQQADSIFLQQELLTLTRTLSRETSRNSDRIRSLATDMVKLMDPLLKRMKVAELQIQRNNLTLQLFMNTSTALTNLRLASIRGLLEIKELVSSIQTVSLSGEIGATLVPPLELSKIVKKVQIALPRGLALVTGTNPLDMYKYYLMSKVHAHSVGHFIRIFIDLPLVSQDHMFKMFQVKVVPVADASMKTSFLYRVPENLFILSDNKEIHGALQPLELQACKGRTPVVCPADNVLYYRQQPTCVSALYRDEQSNIDKLCERVILTTPQPPAWVWHGESHTWYYSLPHREKLIAECQRSSNPEVVESTIHGVGQLVSVSGCTYHTDQYLLFRREGGNTVVQLEKQIINVPSIPMLEVLPNMPTLDEEAWQTIGELVAEGRYHPGPYGDEIRIDDWVQATKLKQSSKATRNWIWGILFIIPLMGSGLCTWYFLRWRKRAALPEIPAGADHTMEEPSELQEFQPRPVFRLSTEERRHLASPHYASVQCNQ